MSIHVSKEEAIATALLAKLVGKELNSIASVTTGSSRNINPHLDVNKVISDLKIIPDPKPEGPSIKVADINGEQREVVLHKIDTPIQEQPVSIENPFAKKLPVTNNTSTQFESNGLSPMAQFLGKKQAAPATEETPTEQLPIEESNKVTSQNNDIIVERLLKIELQLNRLTKLLKKNENKSTKE